MRFDDYTATARQVVREAAGRAVGAAAQHVEAADRRRGGGSEARLNIARPCRFGATRVASGVGAGRGTSVGNRVIVVRKLALAPRRTA